MGKNYRTKFKGYLDDLSEKKPSPGGGSAVCLSFCLGVSLIEKAVNYSLKKDNNFSKYLNEFNKSRKRIFPYIDLDGKIFEKILKEKNEKRSYWLKESEKIIIDLGRISMKSICLAKKIESGIKNSIASDFHIGRVLINTALKGCVYNLEANIGLFGKKSKYIEIFNQFLSKLR